MEQYQKDFLAKYGKDAQETQKLYGIPASVTLAQAALESDWGRSGLAASFYNFFGIKGKGTAGTQYLPTTEFEDGKFKATLGGFANYLTPHDSFMDHGDFLRRNPRYAQAGVFSSKDPFAVADSLQAAGYATDPSYAKKLKDIINVNSLMLFDDSGNASGGGGGLKEWLDKHAPLTESIIVDGNGNVTKNGVPYTPTPDEQKKLDRSGEDIPGRFAGDAQAIHDKLAGNWIQNSAKVLIIVVLVIVLLVLILQVIPLPPQANLAKKVIASV